MKITRIVFYVALVLIVGCTISFGVILNQRANYLRGWENAVAPDSQLPYKVPLVGVNVELTQYDQRSMENQLELIAQLDVTWVRQEFHWSEISPEYGQYDWTQWDRIVDSVDAEPALQLVAVLNLSPAWARHSLALENNTAPPADMADFADFAREFANRYGDSIDYYQIWDEPNLTTAWGNLPPKAADYTAMLESAYTAIHEVDDHAVVLTAGLAPTTETGPSNYSDVLFLRAIYENGGQQYFDAVAGKPYGFETDPYDRRTHESLLNFSRLILLREVMVEYGDADKALWGSHFGWNSLPTDWTGIPSVWGAVNSETQLEYTQLAYTRAAEEWPWIGGLILQTWQPNAPIDDPIWGFSLLQPGAETYGLTGNVFDYAQGNIDSTPPGKYHPVNAYTTYDGDWEFGELGADFGQSGESRGTFVFNGTDIALELRRDNYRAYLYVSVDGQPANALPQDANGRSYIILTASDLEPHIDTILVAEGLSPGTHTLQFEADRGWDQWALAAFRVSSTLDTSSYDRQLILLVVFFVTMAAVIAFSGKQLAWQFGGIVTRLFSLRFLNTIGYVLLGALASFALMVGMLLTWHDSMPSILRRDTPMLILGVMTAGLLYFTPSLILTVIAAMLLWYVIYLRLEIGLYLTLFWVPFYLYPVELYHYAFPMAEVCLLLTASAWGLQRIVVWANGYKQSRLGSSDEGRTHFISRLTSLDWLMFLVFALATVSLIWADYQHVAFREWRMMILEPMLFYTMIRSRPSDKDRAFVINLIRVFIISGVTVAVVSLGMYILGIGLITAEGGVSRLAGVYGSPNNVALYLERVFVFLLIFTLVTKQSLYRVSLGVATVVVLITIVLSQSVGGLLLGAPAGICITLLLWDRKKGVIIIGVLALIVLLAIVPLSQHPRFAHLLDFSEGTSFFRIKLWQSSLQMIQERPVTGYGLDQFLYQYRGHYILPEAWQEPNLSHPHNMLFDFWIRLGLGGVILLCGIQIVFWKTSLHLLQKLQPDRVLQAVTIGAAACMAALLAHGLVDNSVFVVDLSYVFVLIIALPSLLARIEI